MADKTNDNSSNPPFAVPVKPMTLSELLAYHKQNGTLREFLSQCDCGWDR
jgi:hypothetical protein